MTYNKSEIMREAWKIYRGMSWNLWGADHGDVRYCT